MRRTSMFFPLILACACSAGLSEATFPTGSQTVVTSADLHSLLVVDNAGGALSRRDIEGGKTTSVAVGALPERVTRAGSKIYVTVRGERALAVLTDASGELELLEKVDVGAEPIGVVAREDGTRIYVALSQEDAVVELDGSTLAEVRRWSVAGQPSWLALHPSGKALFVASAMGGGLVRVDLDASTVAEVSLAEPVGAGSSGEDRFTRRLTGDLWISSDGDTLAVPGLFVDNLTPADDPADAGVGNSGSGYASTNTVVTSRFNPGVMVAELDASGAVVDTPRAVFLAGFANVGDNEEIVRSYPTSVSMPPRGDLVVVTMESSATAVVLSLSTLAANSGAESSDTGGFGASPRDDGFATGAAVFASMDAGPQGVAFVSDDLAYVDNFLDHSLRALDVNTGRARVNVLLASAETELSDTMDGGESFLGVTTALDAEVEAGRKLFFSAVSDKMAADGAGVSCSTCHFDGRNDGLTWTFSDSVRQTPTLAAAVAETAPYTWTDGVDTVAAEAVVTSQGRMGGAALTARDALDIQAFILSIPEVDVHQKGVMDDAVQRGRAIFASAEVGCASCHPAPLYTDNEHHDIYGLTKVNTPSLVGIASSAPYLHNGSAGDLRGVVDAALNGEMGATGHLSEPEKDDLVAFLATL
ncbi:MAG: hypothetical protein EXR71_11365 [Myxococcales bacterium]|nr:hypothetical protein [Myxococcales bacterium]